jgi:ribosomal protein S18 acetylase RimI-like enzyme
MAIDREMIARMDASLCAYWGAYALADGGIHRELPGALFMQTAIPHSLFNSVILTGQDLAVIDTAIELSAECHKTMGVAVLWRVSPLAEGGDVRARLEGVGLQRGDPSPAMLIDLSDMPPPKSVDGLVIEAADDAERRRDWGRLTIEAFGMEESLQTAMGSCEATIPADMFEDQPRFVGYLEGVPVAVSSLVMTDGVAGVYAVATLPHARKRGIGAAMTLHAMCEGKRRNADVAVLQATDMGRPVYEQIGFRTVFNYQNYLPDIAHLG